MEQPKKLYAWPMDMDNIGGNCLREWRVLGGGGYWRRNQDNYHSIINKIKKNKEKCLFWIA